MNSDIRLLTREEYDKLPGDYRDAIASQFAIALGERYFTEKIAKVQYEGVVKSGYIGTYWIDSIKDKKSEYHSMTMLNGNPYYKSDIGLRFITDIPEDAEIITDKDGNKIIKYGVYPSTIVNPSNSAMISTGEVIDTILVYIDGEEASLPIYESGGKYYAAMRGIHTYRDTDIKLSNDEVISADTEDLVFFEMKPLMWLGLDNGKMITSEIVVSGIPFTKDRTTKISSYDESLVKIFTDNCFSRDIFKVQLSDKEELNEDSEIIYDYDEEPTIYERMSLALSLDQVIYLHGAPASGKSDRILELDPNATVVYLASEDPSLLYGASLLDKKSIDEDFNVKTKLVLSFWVRETIEKAKDDPDNIHILFFDEYTNAHPQVQALIMQLIDNRKIGEYKLPENVRIVLAGNELSDSTIAHGMVEPMKSRIAHIDVDISLNEWLEWAYSHGISSYITTFLRLNEEYLRTEFTGSSPNADPRRWEMANRVFSITHNPKSIKGLIDDKIVDEFAKFCNLSNNITIEEFLKSNRNDYTNTEYKYSVIASLSDKINDSEELYNVIEKMKELYFSLDDIDTFEMCFIKGDEDRREIVDFIDENGNVFSDKEFDVTDDIVESEDKTNDELLKSYIESNVSVFLHGMPGIGKSARIARIDPDCVRVSLANVDKDGIVGTLYLNDDDSQILQAKPSWLVEIEEVCAKDPDNIHILFFDEFTNASGIIQGLIMNVCLYHKVGIGGWPLPSNCRVVAAGNENVDSRAAKKMPAPVYGRFAHLYYELDTEDWLNWAIKNKIHPLVIDFITNKEYNLSNSKNNLSVLMPTAQDEKRVVNPRVWEEVSSDIYKMEDEARKNKINPKLRNLGNHLPDSILESFISFIKNRANILTVEGVLSGKEYNFDKSSYPELLLSVRALLRVDKKDLEKIRTFIETKMGKEILSAFDSMYKKIEGKEEDKVNAKR